MYVVYVQMYMYWEKKVDFLFFSFAELPYGWERIEDPKYGTYYIEYVFDVALHII